MLEPRLRVVLKTSVPPQATGQVHSKEVVNCIAIAPTLSPPQLQLHPLADAYLLAGWLGVVRHVQRRQRYNYPIKQGGSGVSLDSAMTPCANPVGRLAEH